MLPTFTALFGLHARVCERRGVRLTIAAAYDAQIAIAHAKQVAIALAGGREEDEPAALLLALLLEARALGPVSESFPVAAVRELVESRDLELPLSLADRIELRALRARVLAGGHEQIPSAFQSLRALVAARLRPER